MISRFLIQKVFLFRDILYTFPTHLLIYHIQKKYCVARIELLSSGLSTRLLLSGRDLIAVSVNQKTLFGELNIIKLHFKNQASVGFKQNRILLKSS